MRLSLLLLLMLFSAATLAQDKEYTLTIRDHHFVPAQLTIPANTKIKLLVINEDATPEKIVTGKGRITVYIGPLKPGRYPFFGEFHMDTAQGALIAK
jgi:hypothetical protein